jgi:hypothetical protein
MTEKVVYVLYWFRWLESDLVQTGVYTRVLRRHRRDGADCWVDDPRAKERRSAIILSKLCGGRVGLHYEYFEEESQPQMYDGFAEVASDDMVLDRMMYLVFSEFGLRHRGVDDLESDGHYPCVDPPILKEIATQWHTELLSEPAGAVGDIDVAQLVVLLEILQRKKKINQQLCLSLAAPMSTFVESVNDHIQCKRSEDLRD